MSAREFYESTVRHLPAMDRLRLASLILDDLAASSGADLDIRDDWSDEDTADLTAAALKHGMKSAAAEHDNA
jgi:hypothetical protein